MDMYFNKLRAWLAADKREKIECLAAFSCCAGALGFHLWDLLNSEWGRVSLGASLGYVLPVIIALAATLLFRRLRESPHGVMLVSATFFVSSLLSNLAESPRWLHLAVISVALPLMITYLRIGAIWYVLLALLGGVLIGWSTHDPLLGLGSAAALGGMLFVINYLIQLILDHRHERIRFVELRSRLDTKRIIKQTLFFWVPSAALVLLGMWINSIVQDE